MAHKSEVQVWKWLRNQEWNFGVTKTESFVSAGVELSKRSVISQLRSQNEVQSQGLRMTPESWHSPSIDFGVKCSESESNFIMVSQQSGVNMGLKVQSQFLVWIQSSNLKFFNICAYLPNYPLQLILGKFQGPGVTPESESKWIQNTPSPV